MQYISNQAKIQISIYSYKPDDIIGSGYKSQVFRGKNDTNGDLVAIKVCDHFQLSHEVELQLLNQEITALQVLDSINILKLLFTCKGNHHTYIVTEYCNQGDLADLINKRGFIPENEAIIIFYQILQGFKEQISKGVIHRDIKPSNILINNGVYKLADYGFSKMMYAPKDKVYYNVGTTLYMSPQTLTENQYSEKSDVWSLGVMFYQILCGKLPWQAGSEQEFIRVITTTPIQFPKDLKISAAAKDLVIKCLTLQESKRYSCNQLMDHPLFDYFKARYSRRSMQISMTFAETRTKTSHSQQKPNISAQRIKSTTETASKPDFRNYNDAIINILYLQKLILRMAKIIDHFNGFFEPVLKEKLLYFIIKHAIFKSKQILQWLSKTNATIDASKKVDYLKEAKIMSDTFRKSFNKLVQLYSNQWDYIHGDEQLLADILIDKKFAAVFDQSDLEVISHYILMVPVLRVATKDLQQQLHQKLMHIKENDQLDPQEEAAILLLSYLLSYQEICQHVIAHFDDSIFYANKFKLRNLVEEKPTSISKRQFISLCTKIHLMQI